MMKVKHGNVFSKCKSNEIKTSGIGELGSPTEVVTP